MSRRRNQVRDALWQAMIVRAETLNDTAVLGQARATKRAANRIANLAREIIHLAQTSTFLAGSEGRE